MSVYFDGLEVQSPEGRETDLMARLPALIERARQAPGWAKILGDVVPADIRSRKALQTLPVTSKVDLCGLQALEPPFGGINVMPFADMQRIFMSPGPIFEVQGRAQNWWRMARVLHALGLEKGEIIQNCFSYHLTPGAFLIDQGASELGCPVVPAGPGQSELQIAAISTLKVGAYAGTPSFLKIIVGTAQELGRDISSLRKALVSAEALPGSLRSWLRDNGVDRVLQFYGTADVGAIAYETAGDDHEPYPGLVLNEGLILEIVDPSTGQQVPDGDLGELVVTSLNDEYPLIRFGTGDLSAVLPGRSPCGRTNTRIVGWRGRVDQLVKVRGMFIHPDQITQLVHRYAFIQKARLRVDNDSGVDTMTLLCQVAHIEEAQGARAAIVDTLRELIRLRIEVDFVACLPDDGLLIEDVRVMD